MVALPLLLLVALCRLTSAVSLDDDWQSATLNCQPSSADWHAIGWPTADPAAKSESASATSWSSRLSLLSARHQLLASQWTEAVLDSATGETELSTGAFVSGTLALYGDYMFLSYKPTSLDMPFDIFVGVGECSGRYVNCDIHVLMNGSPFAVDANATYNWHYSSNIRIDSAHPLSCSYRNVPLAECEYHYTLMSRADDQQYFTTVMTPPSGLAQLLSGSTQSGTLDGGQSAFFFIANGALNDIIVLALTVTDGDCDLYVSTTIERPGPNNYTWSSRDDGDDSSSSTAHVQDLVVDLGCTTSWASTTGYRAAAATR